MINLNFPKKLRLVKSAQFKSVSDRNQKISSRLFIILYTKNTEDHARLGITVSKKCSKKAVMRNRIKRVVRESFRLEQEKTPIPSYDIVIIAKKQTAEAPNEILWKDLTYVWHQLKKYSHSPSC